MFSSSVTCSVSSECCKTSDNKLHTHIAITCVSVSYVAYKRLNIYYKGRPKSTIECFCMDACRTIAAKIYNDSPV